jgi:CHAT domain-containing protein
VAVKTPATLEMLVLQPGPPLKQSLAPGQSHIYRIDLPSAQFLHVRVEQQGIEVVVRLRDPSGKVLTEYSDHLRGPAGREQLSIISETSGSYVLEVRSTKPEDPPGRYQVQVKELAPARDNDGARVAALRGFHEAMELRAEDTAESRRKAIEKLSSLLPVWEAAGDAALEGEGLQNLGEVYGELGEKRMALSCYEKALVLMQQSGDRIGEGDVRDDLGIVCERLGDYQKALVHYRAGLAIYRELGRRQDEAGLLMDLAWLYREMRLFDQALETFQVGLPVLREVGDRPSEGTALNNMGLVVQDQGDDRGAIKYFEQALAIHRTTGNRTGQAATLHNIGLAYIHLGEPAKAREYLEKSLEICQAIGERYGEAYALTDLGSAAVALGEPSKGLAYFQEALPIRRSVGDMEGESATLRRMALAKRRLGDLEGARRDLEGALANYEIIRGNVLSPDRRSSYFAWARPTFDDYIDVLMALHAKDRTAGYDALALAASEKARARSLLEMLAEARADVRHSVDPALLAREQSLQQELRSKVQEQMKASAGKPGEEAEASRRKAVASVAAEIEQVEEEIRAKSPEFASLTHARPLVLSEVQKEIGAETVLFEYALGEERSFLWAVSQSGMASYELPRRAAIEAAARSVYGRVSARPKGPADLEGYRGDAARLTQMVLAPAAELLTKRRVVIVADGALQFVPFEALPLPGSEDTAPFVPLVRDHEVVSLPSVSTLSVLRRDLAGRPPAPKLVAVIADPVFDGEDVRVPGHSRASSGAVKKRGEEDGEPIALVRSARDVGFTDGAGRIPRLPFTRREAEAILSLVPAGDRKEALDFDASRATAMSPELSQYRFVHFATHGLINTVHPELSGLVLSLVDRQAREQDGFLPSFEIFNLRLPADLVVLSSCRTALGTEVRGEGLVGLTRAFLYAGAGRVVASLWMVDDEATCELMKRFYGGMLGRERMPPAAALRSAQVALAGQRRWEHPYYWAAFVLQGEWN